MAWDASTKTTTDTSDTPLAPWRLGLFNILGACIEGLVLGLVCLSPWAFGAVEPAQESLLYAGVALALVLWAARMLLGARFTWERDPVLLCIGGLFLLGIVQISSLPQNLLRRISPATVAYVDSLLPQQPEVLPGGEKPERPTLAAGSRLSVYPYATQKELIRLLAVFALYAAVRNNIASARALRRLFLALTINGVLLAFFAIVQFFSAPHDTVYWTIKTPGAVFGPFVCRTHFPAYVNLCIGATLGLLAGVPRRGPETDDLLGHSQRLWLGCALALMTAAVALSLARGGVLSLVGGAIVFILLGHQGSVRHWFKPVLLGAALALGLVCWLGFARVENRLGTIYTGEALRQSRLPLWRDAWPLALESPWLGAGYGTFRYVEPLQRKSLPPYLYVEHAHNEFLEAQIEGGVVRLGITVLCIALVLRWAYQVARFGKVEEKALALGALVGVTTLVIHSAGDFGIHLPAIVLTATVLVAQAMGLGHGSTRGQYAPTDDAYTVHCFRLGPVLGAAAALSLALTLANAGGRLLRSESLRFHARELADVDTPAIRDQQLEMFRTATALVPGNAGLHFETGEAYEAAFHYESERLSGGRRSAEAAQLVAVGASVGLPAAVQAVLLIPSQAAVADAWNAAVRSERHRLQLRFLLPALRHYIQARDLNPLLARAQLRLAANAQYLEKADSILSYLDRAKLLITNDADMWCQFGLQEALLGKLTRARKSWRRCLELGDKHLDEIIEIGGNLFPPDVFAEQVLPPRPPVLLKAALFLYPGPDGLEMRRHFLERALALLDTPDAPRNGTHFFLAAQCHQHLDQEAEARQAYGKAIALEPRNPAFRVAYAEYLDNLGHQDAARQEVHRALAAEPGNAAAHALLEKMTRPPVRRPPEPIPLPASVPLGNNP